MSRGWPPPSAHSSFPPSSKFQGQNASRVGFSWELWERICSRGLTWLWMVCWQSLASLALQEHDSDLCLQLPMTFSPYTFVCVQFPSFIRVPVILEIEGKRRGGQQRVKWLDSITNSMDMSLSKLQEMGKDRGAWHATVHGFAKSQTRFSNWTTTTSIDNKLRYEWKGEE